MVTRGNLGTRALNTFLDSAIASLVADGTIAQLMEENGLGGTPGGP